MNHDIQKQYQTARRHAAKDAPITVLHIGEDQTLVAFGHAQELDTTLVLNIGSNRTAQDFFKHTPPTPYEMEVAIMTVEDEVTRALKVITSASALFTTDAGIRELAVVAGISDETQSFFSVEAVERTFDLLTKWMLGRATASSGIPSQPELSARLLILREFMHHLQFEAVHIV